jgi:hypothetical protein
MGMNITFMDGFWFGLGLCGAAICTVVVIAIFAFIGICIHVLTSPKFSRIKDSK